MSVPWNNSFTESLVMLDRHGSAVGGWRQASQLANYWRRHFGVPEDPHPYRDYDTLEGIENTDGPSSALHSSQPPVPITQLAWLLHSILCQDPQGNDLSNTILQTLSTAARTSSSVTPLSSESLSHDGLAQLAGHLAILSNVLPQQRAAASEIPDDHST